MFWNGYRWAKLHIGMQCLMDGQNLKLVGLHTTNRTHIYQGKISQGTKEPMAHCLTSPHPVKRYQKISGWTRAACATNPSYGAASPLACCSYVVNSTHITSWPILKYQNHIEKNGQPTTHKIMNNH